MNATYSISEDISACVLKCSRILKKKNIYALNALFSSRRDLLLLIFQLLLLSYHYVQPLKIHQRNHFWLSLEVFIVFAMDLRGEQGIELISCWFFSLFHFPICTLIFQVRIPRRWRLPNSNMWFHTKNYDLSIPFISEFFCVCQTRSWNEDRYRDWIDSE